VHCVKFAPRPKNIAPLVHAVRGDKVLLDADLASLCGVATKVHNQAVKRNRDRFLTDINFQLSAAEWEVLRSQSVAESRRNVGALPYTFTEEDIAMLSSVLRSPRTVEVNIAIMRAFVQLRRLMDSNATSHARSNSWKRITTNNL
jgi:hypothetical protein